MVEAHPLPPSIGSLTSGTSPPLQGSHQQCIVSTTTGQPRIGGSVTVSRPSEGEVGAALPIDTALTTADCLRAGTVKMHHRRRSSGNPRRGDEESKLVIVKWIHPSVSDHQMLESLRDSGLLIPADTQVLSRCGLVRVLGLGRPHDAACLLATKQSRDPQRKSKAQHQSCYLLVTVPPDCTST